MKQVEVTILGQSYILGCPDDGERELLQAVSMVDREMSSIRDAGKIKARERMAVLAALNLAYRLAEADVKLAMKGIAGSDSSPRSADDSQSAKPELGAEAQALLARIDAVLAEDGRLL